jgi:hypothetical protein
MATTTADDALERVRASCAALLATPAAASPDGGVAVVPSGCLSLAVELFKSPPAAVRSQWQLPLRFESPGQEVNALLLLQLLNCGSGFRADLHAAPGGCGAWETVLRGLLTLHLTGKPLTADALCAFTARDVPEVFGFEPTVEKQVLPAVYQLEPGPLAPLAAHLVRAMNEAGGALRAAGARDFYAWVEAGAAAERAAGGCGGPNGDSPSAAGFVGRLVRAFLPFADEHDVPVGGGGADSGVLRVALYKKAQLAASHLSRRFAAELPGLFAFHDVDRLTVAADNVLPAVMRAFGALALPADLAARVDAGQPLPAGADETRLRAAAVVAGGVVAAEVRALAAAAAAHTLDRYVSGAGAGRGLTAEEAAVVGGAPAATLAALAALTECELDELLWGQLGKRADMRALPRHATRDTYFY